MHAKITLTLTALLFLTAKGSPAMDDAGPQTFSASTPSPLSAPSPSPLTHYEEKEVIVYLTASQIQALQSGQGILEPVIEPLPQPEDIQQHPELLRIPQSDHHNNVEFRKELERQKAYIETQPNIDEAIETIQKQKGDTPPPVKEPPREEPQEETPRFSWYPTEENKYSAPAAQDVEDNNKYYGPSTEQPEEIKFYAPSSDKAQKLHPKSYNYFSVYNEKKGDNINIKIFHPAPKDKLRDALDAKKASEQINKKYNFVPYEYLSKKLALDQAQGSLKGPQFFAPAQLQEQFQSQAYGQEESKSNEQNLEEESLKQKYAKYNDQKQAIELQNILKKQKADAQAEAIAKAPPVEVQREVTITKRKPVPVIKHVQVPVPQPYIVRIPEPFEVKVPQPYAVPLEIIRHIPVEVVKTEKIEVEKPVPYEVEKRVPVPVTKKVYVKVDKPYFVEKVVPVEVRKEIPVHVPVSKPQKLTIIRHVWEH